LEPNHVSTLYNKGIVYQEIGRLEEALELWDKALDSDPNSLQQERILEAKKEIEAQIEKNNNPHNV